MKKDKEWLKGNIATIVEMVASPNVFIHTESAKKKVFEVIDQLDEPEMTVAQAWEVIGAEYGEELLKNNIEYVESNGYVVTKKTAIPVIPKYVAEFISSSKGWLNLYGALDQAFDDKKEIGRWIDADNEETFARAWLDGYEVEKEKRYRLRLVAPQIKGNWYLALKATTSLNPEWLMVSEILADYERTSEKPYYQAVFTESELADIDETGFVREEITE